MSDLERAIFAAAYVDALRNMFDGLPTQQRVLQAKTEAEYVVAAFRQHGELCAATKPLSDEPAASKVNAQ